MSYIFFFLWPLSSLPHRWSCSRKVEWSDDCPLANQPPSQPCKKFKPPMLPTAVPLCVRRRHFRSLTASAGEETIVVRKHEECRAACCCPKTPSRRFCRLCSPSLWASSPDTTAAWRRNTLVLWSPCVLGRCDLCGGAQHIRCCGCDGIIVRERE